MGFQQLRCPRAGAVPKVLQNQAPALQMAKGQPQAPLVILDKIMLDSIQHHCNWSCSPCQRLGASQYPFQELLTICALLFMDIQQELKAF